MERAGAPHIKGRVNSEGAGWVLSVKGRNPIGDRITVKVLPKGYDVICI